jgi:NTE family protein
MFQIFRKRPGLKKLHAGKKLGLALGGGAVLGAAHIGVLKYFHEHDISIHFLSGTSIGAFVAALCAFGKTIDEMEHIALNLDWLEISGLKLSKYGLLSNEKLGKTLRDQLGDVTFEESPIPLAIVTADLNHGEKVVIRSGDVAQAVMASTCLPGIYHPIEFGERLLVDGGLVENVPVTPLLEAGAHPTVAVDLNAQSGLKRPEHIIDVLVNSIMLSIDNAARIQAEKADILITPELGKYSMTNTKNIAELIEVGYDSAQKALE